MSVTNINVKAIVIGACFVLLSLGLLFSYFDFPSGKANISHSGLTAKMNFKEIKEVPEAIITAAANLKPEQKTVKMKFGQDEKDVFYRELKPAPNSPARSRGILLLHGARFSSSNWENIGTIQFLSALGFHVVAVDLPGYGNSHGIRVGNRNSFMSEFAQAVKLDRPYIVSPSMSGGFALPYLLDNTGDCSRVASGYIPVAPVGTSQFTADQYKACKIPVMIVTGTRDTGGIHSKSDLEQFPNHVVRDIQDAGHPAYLDDPKYWHKILYSFLVPVDSATEK